MWVTHAHSLLPPTALGRQDNEEATSESSVIPDLGVVGFGIVDQAATTTSYTTKTPQRASLTKTPRKSAHQQRCRPHTTDGGTVEHYQILLRHLPDIAYYDGNPNNLRRNRRGLRKQDS
ncbi:hypothetical protein TNCV_3621601 [Trichonephila clavipes]|nr:hypothetical protein TNCV_3621601 [Trichonephila clavipes]